MTEERPTRPQFSSGQAIEIAERQFGVAARRADPLPSDRDQNFLLEEESSERRYVLKISKAGEDPRVLDLQNRILEHLARAGFPTSNVLFAEDGKEVAAAVDESGDRFQVRLLTWIPGSRLCDIRPHSSHLLTSLGAFLGGMDRALEDFSHPAQDRALDWDLRRAGEVISSRLEFVESRDRRSLLERLSREFLRRLAPLVPDLRLSVIHGDGNDHNVLVSDLGPDGEPESRRVAGVVDFGDACRSYTVAEAAIAGAYAMLGKGDPLAAGAQVVKGYHRALPMREAEIEALFPLMGLRLCTSVVLSAFQKSREPENDYLVVSEGPAWHLLSRLDAEVLDLPRLLFREACDLDPVPSLGRVVAWLQSHGPEASPVVGRREESGDLSGSGEVTPLDLSRVPVHVFDLGVDSSELVGATDPGEAEAWTKWIFRTLREKEAEVGVGRYDEARRWYTTPLFRAPGGDPPEWRTVHLGIDLFVEPGSPVLAPMNAVVHSLSDNDGKLDYGPTVILEHHAPVELGGSLKFWTLYGHLGREVLSRLYPGQPLARGEPFADVGDASVNGGWPPHLHFQVVVDLMGLEGDVPGVAAPSRRSLWKALCPDPNLILGIPEPPSDTPDGRRGTATQGPARPGRPSGAPLSRPGGRSREEILQARHRHLGPTLSVSYRNPLKIVRGSGVYLMDDMGQSFLDCVNNVPHVGHGHPRVVEAGHKQMALLNTNTRYLHDLLVEYARRLVATLPGPLSVVYFTCTGSEANELALRMARTHTGRRDVVVVEGGYHGNTSALVDISSYKFDGPGGHGPPSWVYKTLMPDPYRGRFRAVEGGPEPGSRGFGEEVSRVQEPGRAVNKDGSSREVEYLPADKLGSRYADHVRELVEAMSEEEGGPAAFFCESMLGCGGQIVLPPGYMAGAFEHVRNAGGICIADEVQVGFGRVGTHFWAFETQGVIPDIVTLGKPMGNGHPVSAVVTTPEIAESFDTGMEYFNTFGGNPVSCAIGLAVLDVIQEEGLQANALHVGEHLLAGLQELKEKHEVVGDVRGLGLYVGVELVEDREKRTPGPARAARVKERARDHRILLSTDGPQENVLKIKPPLVFSREDADRVVTTLDGILLEDGIRIG